jgi:hypothetical protein
MMELDTAAWDGRAAEGAFQAIGPRVADAGYAEAKLEEIAAKEPQRKCRHDDHDDHGEHQENRRSE